MGVKSPRGTLTCLALAAAIALGATKAGATPTVSLYIGSNVGGTYDTYNVTDAATIDNGDGTFSLSGVGYGTTFNCDWALSVNPDPSITGTFNLTNLSASSQTFILTITLPVSPIGAPTRMGGDFGTVTYTDQNLDGSVTLATVGSDSFYRALIDAAATPGAPPVGDLGVFSLSATGSGVSGTVSQQTFGAPIPSAVGPAVNSSIGIRIKFNLTAGDRVQIPVFFQVEPGVVTPEPQAALLIGLGLLGFVAARKRARA